MNPDTALALAVLTMSITLCVWGVTWLKATALFAYRQQLFAIRDGLWLDVAERSVDGLALHDPQFIRFQQNINERIRWHTRSQPH